MKLVEVDPNKVSHIRHLYIILNKREFNISHSKKTSYKNHKKFVQCHPYRFWYLIVEKKNHLGSIYVTNENVVGINVIKSSKTHYLKGLKTILKMHKPLDPIKSIRSKFFVINVRPDNHMLIEAIKSLDLTHIQNTYIFKK